VNRIARGIDKGDLQGSASFFLLCYKKELERGQGTRSEPSDRVGGGVTPAVLPHHLAYGSVPRRFCPATLFVPHCLSSYKRPALPREFRPLPPASRPSYEASAKEAQKIGSYLTNSSALRRVASSTHMASADFCQPIPSPLSDGSTWQTGRPPRVRTCDLHPIYPPHLLLHLPGDYRALDLVGSLPDVAASMRLLFVGPGLCLQLPSDSTSRWTPLLFG